MSENSKLPSLIGFLPSAFRRQTPGREAVEVSSRAEVTPTLQEPSVTSPTLDEIGRGNERVRNLCLDIVHKVATLGSLESDLTNVFEHVSTILGELEQTKGELLRRNAVLKLEQEAHAALRTRLAASQEENERLKIENAQLDSDSTRFTAQLRSAEGKLAELKPLLARSQASETMLRRQIEEEQLKSACLEDEIQALREEIERSGATLASSQVELASLRLHNSNLEQDVQTLQSMVTEGQSANARLTTDLADHRIALEAEGRRAATLEASLAAERAERNRTHALWQSEVDSRNAEIANLRSKLEIEHSHLEASQKMQAQAADALQTKIVELRQEERRVQEGLTTMRVLEKKLESASAKVLELQQEISSLNESQAALVGRVEPLVAALNAKETQLREANNRLDAASQRLVAEREQFQAVREPLEQQVKDLTDQLETERSGRAIAEGALKEDREDRLHLQSALDSAQRALTPTGLG